MSVNGREIVPPCIDAVIDGGYSWVVCIDGYLLLHQCVFPQLYVICSHSSYSFVGGFTICLLFFSSLISHTLLADESCNNR